MHRHTTWLTDIGNNNVSKCTYLIICRWENAYKMPCNHRDSTSTSLFSFRKVNYTTGIRLNRFFMDFHQSQRSETSTISLPYLQQSWHRRKREVVDRFVAEEIIHVGHGYSQVISKELTDEGWSIWLWGQWNHLSRHITEIDCERVELIFTNVSSSTTTVRSGE